MKRMQLYNGNSLDDFLHIKSILERNNIRFDTENTLSGGKGRMLGNLLVFGRPSSGLQDEHRQDFKIFVDEHEYYHGSAKNNLGIRQLIAVILGNYLHFRQGYAMIPYTKIFKYRNRVGTYRMQG